MTTTPRASGWDAPEPHRPTPTRHDHGRSAEGQLPSDMAGPTAGPTAGPATGPASPPVLRLVSAGHTPQQAPRQSCDSSSARPDGRFEQARPKKRRGTRSGDELRGQVLLTLACVRLATPEQLRRLLVPHHKATDSVRRALRDLMAESPALTGRVKHGRQSIWHLTGEGIREAGAAGEAPDDLAKTTGKAAARTSLRKHALAVVDTAIAFHDAGAAHVWDWDVEVAHPAPGRQLVTDAVVILSDATVPYAFVEVDRGTQSLPKLREKMRRYEAYQRMAPTGRTTDAKKHWQHRYNGGRAGGFPPVLWVFTGDRSTPATREKSFHRQVRHLYGVGMGQVSVATTTLDRLQEHGPLGPVWHLAHRPGRRVALADVPAGDA